MAQNVDSLYPELSAVAQSQGKTLNELGKGAKTSHRNYLSLGDCCWFILNNLPRWGAAGPYNYLATLNVHIKAYIKNLGHPAATNLWKKLTAGQGTFLDTVVEAAWAIYFKSEGYGCQLYVRLDPANPASKDADFLVTIKGKRWYLDVSSIGAPHPGHFGNLPVMHSPGRRDIEVVVSELAKKAVKKYNDKFKDAIRSGLLVG